MSFQFILLQQQQQQQQQQQLQQKLQTPNCFCSLKFENV